MPFAAGSFDIVFCVHGAMNFTTPTERVPEVARRLRPGGLFAFCHLSPIANLCWSDDADRAGDRLVRDYFGMHRIDAGDKVVFQLPYGEWIRLFLANGFEILGRSSRVRRRIRSAPAVTMRSEPGHAAGRRGASGNCVAPDLGGCGAARAAQCATIAKLLASTW